MTAPPAALRPAAPAVSERGRRQRKRLAPRQGPDPRVGPSACRSPEPAGYGSRTGPRSGRATTPKTRPRWRDGATNLAGGHAIVPVASASPCSIRHAIISRERKLISGKSRVTPMNIGRCLSWLCLAFLVAGTGCNAGIATRQDTDAEVSCREQGFDIGSDAYADCIENWSKSN